MTNSSRNLFSYDPGSGSPVYGDPLFLTRSLHGTMGGEVNKYLSRTDPAQNGPGVVLQAWDKLIAATRQAFRLLPFDPATGGGATDEHAVGVLRSFLSWCAEKKKKSDSGLTSPPPSAPTS